MKRMLAYALSLALLQLAWFTATAQALEPEGRPILVAVGINDYQDPQILDRRTAEQDATALYDLFVAKKHLGIEAKHAKLLLGRPDKKRNAVRATRENILKALKWVAKTAGKDDLVVVAFFGQGGPNGNRTCFFASDSTFKDRSKNAIDSTEIEAVFKKLKSQRGLVLLDINFLGFKAGKAKHEDPDVRTFYRAFLANEESSGAFSRVLFLANSGLRPSLPAGEHSLFATVLLSGLRGKADTAGYEPDGVITVAELAKYVRDELTKAVRARDISDEEKQKQLPVVLEGQIRDFLVDHNPEIWTKTQARLKRFRQIAKKNKLDPHVVEEGIDLLSRMPKLKTRQELRRKYQALADGKITVAQFTRQRQAILDSLRLTERELATYATKVFAASRRVMNDYYKEVNRNELIAKAIEGLYKRVNEKIPTKIQKRLDRVKDLSLAELVTLLKDARRHLGRREDLAEGQDLTYSLHRMLNSLDRHTDYYDPKMVDALRRDTTGNFTGIGVQIRRNFTKDALEVVTPLIGSPAYKAGIYRGDLIRTIIREVDAEGNPLPKPEIISTKGMSTEDAVKKILGKPGTKVKIIIEREGAKKPLEFNLIRGSVELESVMGYKRNKDDSWNYVIDPDAKICYVRLTQFSRNTKRDLANVMKKLSKAGIKGFILDLRFNPGGLLDSAVSISDLFIDDGMIVTIKPRKGPQTSYIGKSEGSYLEFPMVCLVNGYSASGSEIVAACLQDHGRAIIIGSRSYGKGSVQTIHSFETNHGEALLKLTTATFWRPSGKNLNKSSTKGRPEDTWGVKPNPGFDIKLSPKELGQLQEFMRENEIIYRPDRPREKSSVPGFRDRQLEAALRYLRGQIQTASTAEKGKGVASR